MFMVFSLSYGQCTVSQLPDSTQKKILSKFIQLDECMEYRKEDSAYISDLTTLNSNLAYDYTQLNNKFLKRRKWPWIALGGGLVGGYLLGRKF
jgi:hypothetical protein